MDNAILEQNRLLKEQNELLRQTLNSSQAFVKDLYTDEMRAGYLVTSHRKKLWNVQIGLINEFARVCRKYDLRWFACYGTLLGAARHKGFIPWDDDVDVIMLRPDYDKFLKIAFQEIKYPYFVDNYYNYRFESEGASLDDDEGDFQFITVEQANNDRAPHLTFVSTIKIRDSRTTMIEFENRRFTNQGIWIDIFPFDPVPPFTNQQHSNIFATGLELLFATVIPHRIRAAIDNNQPTAISKAELNKFLQLPYRQRGSIYDDFMIKNFHESEYLGVTNNFSTRFNARSFKDVTYMPFEEIELPAPIGYDDVLTTAYGDWHQLVIAEPHVQDYSADIPYKQYIQQSALMR